MENQEIPNKVVKLKTSNLDVFYSHFQALKNVNLNILENTVTSVIGPSGCGKSTFIRLFNRMNDYIEGYTMSGDVFVNNKNIYKDKISIEDLRKEVGMVFQKPTPFPKSIFDNVAYGLRIQGIKDKSYIEERVETALKQVVLFDEVKDNLKRSALSLSGGQQQRLCIARTLAVEPSVLLMDEPTSSLDPIATGRIEELIYELKENYTIVMVTHNMQQASRVSEYTAFFYMGEMVEFGKTKDIFTKPVNERTENYITGRIG